MTSQPGIMSDFIDAAADRVARLIAETQREARRESELRAAVFAAKMAELETSIASVAEIERRLAERLASVKDGEPGRDGASVAIEDVLPVLTEAVERTAAEHAERVLATWDKPQDGKSVSADDVVPMIRDLVASAIAEIPVPKDGQNGVDGKDAIAPAAEDIAALVRDDITREAIEAAKAEIASWERPKDGKDFDPEELRKAVSEAVAAIERPKDGVDGVGIVEMSFVDTDLVVSLSDGRTVQGRVAGWDGVDIDIDRVQEQIAETISRLWEECPKPKDGAPGERGPEGPAGKLPIVKHWQDRVYYEGEVVTFDGAAFQALRDTGKAPGHEDWACIVRAGRDGADGRSFAIRGTWDETAEYDALDVVSLNGASFVARHDNPGVCPGEGWQLMASQGKRGKPGEKGDAGVGLRGLPGTPIKRVEISDDGVLMLHNGDGSTVECDLYPLLSKIGG